MEQLQSQTSKFQAYKPIMRARSSTFKELLSNGTDRLRIFDLQPKVLRKMVEFCNTDAIRDYEYEETSLFALGHDYKIDSLMGSRW